MKKSDNIYKSLEFLRKDLDAAEKQWEGGKEFMSLLQREYTTLKSLLLMFDSLEDEGKWKKEYETKKRATVLGTFKRRIAFLRASEKEFHEDYDPEVTDVDFMRLLEVSYTDPRYVIEKSIGSAK